MVVRWMKSRTRAFWPAKSLKRFEKVVKVALDIDSTSALVIFSTSVKFSSSVVTCTATYSSSPSVQALCIQPERCVPARSSMTVVPSAPSSIQEVSAQASV